ncbi:EAL domain-containing protein [Paenalkalicoccus suaedae]|uniref:EAL domain-containing protein n=1 Tax=Paenalkalicoccus suaedae TaxID=2592382 RepID=A0A859FF77_9BACI|nr:EAL domain-containing protein [Paenalkalicoccus suaedae]QKS71631.1 EAL domain-containing protein [Paenalkalicoccus suaedae]
MKYKILDVMSISLLTFGALLFLANFLNEQALGDNSLSLLVSPIFIVVLGAFFFKKKLSYSIRVYINLIAVFLVGLLSVHFYGMIGPGMMFFLASSFIGTVLLERKAALTFIAVSFLTFTVYNLLWVLEVRQFNFDVIPYSTSFETYVSRMMTLLFFGGLILLNQYRIIDFLVDSLQKLGDTNQTLSEKEEQVREQYNELLYNREHAKFADHKYEVLVENTDDAIFSLDATGELTSVNSSLLKLVNKKEYQLVGQKVSTVLPDSKNVQLFNEHLAKLLNSRGSVEYITEVRIQDVSNGTYHVKLTPVINAKNEILLITGRAHDVSTLVEKEEKIKQLAYFDQLTQLPNRVLFEQQVTSRLSSHADDYHIGILYLDLDNFKKVNDTMGHDAGDDLLRTITERLKPALTSGEMLSRMGGDEFALLIMYKKTEVEDFPLALRSLTRRILELVGEPVKIHDMLFYLSASVGIVMYPQHGQSFEELMQNGDAAMYRAKNGGKNQYRFYSNHMKIEINESILVEAELREALNHQELSIHYQPLYDAGTSTLRGFEALMRWNSTKLGHVFPDKFIPVLEQTGLIIPYGEWVFREACLENKRYQVKTGARTIMSINISPIQFKDIHFIKNITSILQEVDLAPEFVEIEITESILIDQFDSIVEKLKELRALGVRIALDDFGTGFSSLSYLRKLPIDTLKIDKSFIDDILIEHHPRMIIASIVSMAHEMKLEVVAEGVETKEQVQYLTKHNCDTLQGYYFAKPQLFELLEEKLGV